MSLFGSNFQLLYDVFDHAGFKGSLINPLDVDLMCYESYRLETFIDWPHKSPSAEQMAKAGFYFTGGKSGDAVQCAYGICNFSEWKPTDDVLEIHRSKGFPNCNFFDSNFIINVPHKISNKK